MGPEPLDASFERRGAGAGADRQAHRGESGVARSACRRRSSATSMRAKRCTAPVCRRCGDRRRSRQRQDARHREPSGWRRRSRPSCARRSPARNVRIAPVASASTSARASRAERLAAVERSAESRRPAARRSTVRRVSADVSVFRAGRRRRGVLAEVLSNRATRIVDDPRVRVEDHRRARHGRVVGRPVRDQLVVGIARSWRTRPGRRERDASLPAFRLAAAARCCCGTG